SPTPAAAGSTPKSGAEVVAAACNNCHIAGVLGAPKIGDKAAWEQRLAAGGGIDALTSSVINGKGAMPARGGAVLTDAEIRAGVEHMLTESGVAVAGAAPENEAPAAPSAEKPMAAAVMPVAAPASPPPSAGAPVDLAKGESVYGMACLACHTTGAAGAPKLGDKAVWAPRIAQGMEVLHASAINGKGAMPPKGGRVDLPDADIQAAVAYMVKAAE
ncbi:MAG: c-type cytochrome, partial [Sedimenticolaceae bacterium]